MPRCDYVAANAIRERFEAPTWTRDLNRDSRRIAAVERGQRCNILLLAKLHPYLRFNKDDYTHRWFRADNRSA
jgi:hypothetical protein